MSRYDDGTAGLIPAVPGRARRSSRGRRLVVLALTGVLTWSGVSFMAASGDVTAPVSILPGASADGSVASIRPLTDTVTSSNGGANKQSGVKFARIDVAAAAQNHLRVTLAWQNPGEFARNTGTRAWQIRLGLYYPVRTGSCTGSDPDHAVTVPLSASESYSGSAQSFCAYRDTSAVGPGAVTTASDPDQGTQLLATDYLVGTLQPKVAPASPATCTATGTTACVPAGLGANRRTYLAIGTLTNPGGHAPPGQVNELLGVELFVRATRVGG